MGRRRLEVSSRRLARALLPGPARRVVRAGRQMLSDAQQWVFERPLGISTRGHLYLEDVGKDAPEAVHYEPCEWLPIRRALRALRPRPDGVFVDLGSGRGQALVIAGLERYGRVIGVEFVDELTQDARRNIAAARPRLRAAQIEAVTADALAWAVPDDLSVVFLYCPFVGRLFQRALERIFESYDRNPRQLHVVYAYPWEHNWLLGTERVVVEDVRPAQWPPWPWWWRTGWALVTYRVVSPGDGHTGIPDVRRRLFRPRRALQRWSAPNDHTFKLVRAGTVVATSVPERRPDGDSRR